MFEEEFQIMIYYDLACCSDVVKSFGDYSGGANYAILLLRELMRRLKEENKKLTLIISGHLPQQLTDENDLHQNGVKVIRCKDIENMRFLPGSVLFVPIVYGSNLLKIHRVKKREPGLKICATLHDRQHNYDRYDWYDSYYPIAKTKKGILGFIRFYMRKAVFDIVYERCIGDIDHVFTVSNYSMQKLLNAHIHNISCFYQADIFKNCEKNGQRGDYILLVGGGRSEKNLIRALEAFERYKRKTGSAYKFTVTGISGELKKALYRCSRIGNRMLKQDVNLLPYVTQEKLSELYSNCRYVIFPSKGEGFGLPVLEAMSYGKTVLASRTTAVPEVAGSCMIYIDPFSVSSIAEGMKMLDNDRLLDRLEQYAKERYKICKKTAAFDTRVMTDKILEL